MTDLAYRLIQDRHKRPLIVLDSSLGNGMEISPDALRRLSAEFAKIADEAEARDMGKGYVPALKTARY